MIKVTLFGAAGRMGSAVLSALTNEKDIEVAFAVDIKEKAGEIVNSYKIVADDSANKFFSDIWIDVSIADTAFKHAQKADANGIPILIGATGFSEDQTQVLNKLSVPNIIAPNLSIGINLLLDITPKIRRILGDAYDVALIDTHHKHKLDSPSGTAKKLAEGLNREGPDIQVVSIRAGEIIGEHKILFAVDGEEIEITHRAESRMAFARGVAPAIRFLLQKESGNFNMNDVLGLNIG